MIDSCVQVESFVDKHSKIWKYEVGDRHKKQYTYKCITCDNVNVCKQDAPFNFFDFLEHNRCLKIPKGPAFQIFRHYETVQNCHFSSDIRFSQYISTKLVFQYYPKFERNIRSKALYPNFWRYFRSIFRFTEEEAEVRKQVLAFVPAAISELLKRFPSTEGFLWVKLFCEFFIKKRLEHFLKILHFLSLRYNADFGRSRVVFCLDWSLLLHITIHIPASKFPDLATCINNRSQWVIMINTVLRFSHITPSDN